MCIRDSYDYWIVNLTGSGNILWQKCLGGSDNDQAYSILPAMDSGYVVAGATYSNDGDVTGNHGSKDYWVVKLYPFVISGMEENNVPELQVYPNPSSDLFTFR